VSKARLVITAVLIEGRSQSQVARDYGVSQSWISRIIARYTLEGDAAFEPRSRRPHTSPTRLPQTTIDLVAVLRTELTGQRLDAGPHTIAWHLKHHHYLQLSDSAGGMSLNPAGSGARLGNERSRIPR
jgi:hypothetical protein